MGTTADHEAASRHRRLIWEETELLRSRHTLTLTLEAPRANGRRIPTHHLLVVSRDETLAICRNIALEPC